MKSIEQFAVECGKKPSTVREWIRKGYIPGAAEDGVPDSAREPYTSARAKGGKALIKSILKGCAEGKGIVPELYDISREQFVACMESLEREGMIYSHQEDGLTYYDITARGQDSLRTFSKAEWITLCGVIAAWFPILLQLLQVI